MIITAHIKQSFTYAKTQGVKRGENKFTFDSFVIADAEHWFMLSVGRKFLVNGYNETSCLITYDGVMYSVFFSWEKGLCVECKGQF